MDQVRSSSSSGGGSSGSKILKQDDNYVEPIDALTASTTNLLVRENEFSFSLESILRNKHNFCCDYYCCTLERPKIFIDYTTFEDDNDDNGKILFV